MSESGINWGEKYTESELENIDTDIDTDPIEVKKDPIGTFADSAFDTNAQERYVKTVVDTLKEFESFVYHEHDVHPCNISEDHIVAFADHLKDGEAYVMQGPKNGVNVFDSSLSTRTIRLKYIDRFYTWLDKKSVISDNPAEPAIDSLELNVPDRDRPLISIKEMSNFLHSLSDPFVRAWIIVLLKTGARRGEIANIDLRDVHIDHPIYHYIINNLGVSLTSEIESKPDSLFIMGGFNSGTKIRGEVRSLGNKRSRDDGTVIPIDTELKFALIEYILARQEPDPSSSCHPLFVNQSSFGKTRITRDGIRRHVFGALREYNNWYTSGASIEEKVDNHYFRHYFTHNHRHMRGVYDDYMPDGLRAYIRGDADSSGDNENANTARNTVYSHSDWDDWNRTIEEPYLDAIYKFGIYD